MSSTAALYILGVGREVEAVESYWTWIGKVMTVV